MAAAAKPVSVGAVGNWLSRKSCDDVFYQRMLATSGSDTGCQQSASSPSQPDACPSPVVRGWSAALWVSAAARD